MADDIPFDPPYTTTPTYDPTTAHYRLYPVTDGRTWALWKYRDDANGYEAFTGSLRRCLDFIQTTKREQRQ